MPPPSESLREIANEWGAQLMNQLTLMRKKAVVRARPNQTVPGRAPNGKRATSFRWPSPAIVARQLALAPGPAKWGAKWRAARLTGELPLSSKHNGAIAGNRCACRPFI